MMNIWQPIWENWVGEFDESILPVYAYYDWVNIILILLAKGHMVVLIILALLGKIILISLIIRFGRKQRILGLQIMLSLFSKMLFYKMDF